MAPLLAVAAAHGLAVLEDVAQAFGGSYHGCKLGTLGTLGAFSFYPSKNLGAYGDGGLIITDDDRLAERVRMLQNYGAKQKFAHELVGYNSRLDEMQAAVLRVKLPHVDGWNAHRQQIAQRYAALLANIPAVTVPYVAPYATHVYHQYTVRLPHAQRDHVRRRLAEAGIDTMLYYPTPLHRLPLYSHQADSLPQAEAAVRSMISLPIGSHVSQAVQDRIIAALSAALK